MTDDSSASGQQRPGKIDVSRPHSARIWNYWLGGKDNYPVDREVGEEFLAIFPGQADIARHARAFLGRVVRYLAGEAGIRQFLDIGTGLPTVDNTHEVAQRVAPESRIVYVDNDPLVLAHARALLTSSPEGACDYIDADLHDPDTILTKAARTLSPGAHGVAGADRLRTQVRACGGAARCRFHRPPPVGRFAADRRRLTR